MGGFTIRRIDELGSIHGGMVKLAAAELGVESFGLQVLDFPAGFDHYPAHDHSDDGQEEVYVVLSGSAAFEVDGEHVALSEGQLLRVPADSRRGLTTEEGVRILAIGCTPRGAYVRPDDFELKARA